MSSELSSKLGAIISWVSVVFCKYIMRRSSCICSLTPVTLDLSAGCVDVAKTCHLRPRMFKPCEFLHWYGVWVPKGTLVAIYIVQNRTCPGVSDRPIPGDLATRSHVPCISFIVHAINRSVDWLLDSCLRPFCPDSQPDWARRS